MKIVGRRNDCSLSYVGAQIAFQGPKVVCEGIFLIFDSLQSTDQHVRNSSHCRVPVNVEKSES